MSRTSTLEYIYKAVDKMSPVLKKINKNMKMFSKQVKLSGVRLDRFQEHMASSSLDAVMFARKISGSGKSVRKLNRDIRNLDTSNLKKAKFDVNAFGKSLNVSTRGVSGLNKKLTLTQRILSKSKGFGGKAVGALTSKLAGVAALVGSGFGLTKFLTVGSRFEDSMLDLSAITGATGKDMEFLKDKALELGRASKTFQDEVAGGMTMIASAKPELLNNLPALAKTTEQVLLLKNAAGIGMAEASDVLATSLNTFGKSAKSSAEFVNILAAGSKFGSSMIADTGQAALISGGLARQAGLDFLQLNAVIQTAARGGFKRSIAGTAIGQILNRMQKLGGINFKKLGLTKSFSLVKKHIDSLGDPIKETIFLSQLFGEEHSKVAVAIMNNVEWLDKYETQLKGTNVAQEQADKRLAATSAQWRGLWVIIQEKVIKAFDRLQPKISEIITRLGEWVDQISEDDIDEWSKGVRKAAEDAATLAGAIESVVSAGVALGKFFGAGIDTGIAVATGGKIDYSLNTMKKTLNDIFGFDFEVELPKIKPPVVNPPAIKMPDVGDISSRLDVGQIQGSKSIIDVNLNAPANTIRNVESVSTGHVNLGVNAA